MKQIEEGVMPMKDGKAWGVVYSDGKSTSYGWIDPCDAEIHDPKFCKTPTSVTYKNSPDTRELETASLVRVRRTTVVEVLES